MMPGHSTTSTRVFNPLDILANAASLIPKTMTPQQDTVTSDPTPTSDNVSTSEDLEKMFDEHNYGNSKKVVVNKISHSSFSSDLVPKGKEVVKLKDSNRRVIVTVVNRSGDQRVVKTFSSVKAVKNILKPELGVEDKHAGEGGDEKHTEEEQEQDTSDATKSPEPLIIFSSEKSKQDEKATTDVISQQNIASPVSVNSKSIDSSHQAVQNTCENETQPNTSIVEKTGSNSSHPSNKDQVNLAQVTCLNTNSLEQGLGESSSVTCLSDHQSVEESSTCKQGQESPSQDDISESRPLTKDGNSEQNKENQCTGAVDNSHELNNLKMTISSPGTCIEGSSVEETESCAIHVDSKPSEISENEQKLPVDLSRKGEYIGSPEGCCFKLCEDVSDSESWRYEGNRGDIRLSLDLDSPKSERNENPSPASEMGRTKTSDTSLDSVLSPRTDEDGGSELVESPKCSSAALISNMDHCYAGPTQSPQPEEKDQVNTASSSSVDCHKNGVNLKDLLLNHKNAVVVPADKGNSNDLNHKTDNIKTAVVSEPQLAKTVQTAAPKEVSPKFGKYRIGTFASVSNTAIGLESPKKKGPLKATSLLTNTVYTNNVPLVVTQGARTSQFSDLTLQQVLERKWVSVTDHDHDYCLPRIQGPQPSAKPKKAEDKRVKKVVQTDSTDTESNDEFIPDDDSLPSSPLPTTTTRQRAAKAEKVADYIKGGTSDSKLKITGKYQDDYIYFLNTKLRSRRRTTSVDQKTVPPNKIVVPLPKPGDIVVPHLTDADLELIKSGQSDKIPQQMCSNTDNLQALKPSGAPPTSVANTNSISDEESKIINTILSMETGEQNPPGPVTEIPNFGEPPALFGGTNDDILNLTPEQMEILFNAMDEVQSESPDISTAENKFNLEVPTSTSTSFPTGVNGATDQQMFPNSNGPVSTSPPTSGSSTVSTANSYPELSTSASEKSLDLFGSELKLFPEAAVDSNPVPLQKPSLPSAAGAADSDTSAPWIVTVSMYWNDLPAIMIDNAPFVRLVDIHKQILPAKDTGILKKRCQLLGIDVLNCSEMQRYFLVQYGKAFNSKSTLIISKDDAKSLIGYYVNPGSHPPRVRCRTVGGKNRTPVHHNSSKKNHTKAAVEIKEEVRESDPLPAVPPPPPPAVQLQQPQSRTRHKKINFLELLKGDTNNNTTEEHDVEVKEDAKPEKTKRGAARLRVEGEGKGSAEKKLKLAQSESEGKIITCNSEELGKGKSNQNKLKNGSLQSKKLKFEKSKKYPGPLKVKWTVFSNNKQQQTDSEEELHGKENILSVVHKDMTSVNGQRGRMQAGNVFLDLYKGPLAPCIRCCTCEKLFSIDNFLKHLHDINGSNKLLVVRQPQTFALRDLSPSVYQKKLWEYFFKKRKAFNEELKQKRTDKEKQTSVQRESPGISRSSDVRISARKRRPKQLHPIENYRYNLPKGTASNTTEKGDASDVPTPSKLRKTMDTSCEDINGVEGADSVVTLTNGPEVISFTALEGAFDI